MAASNQDNGTSGLIAGINVTPLVDVVLVLLIIFIVTARMVVAPNAALKLTLPTASSGEQVTPVFAVTLTRDGVSRVNGQPVASDAAFLSLARSEHQRHPDLRAVIQADGEVHHARVVKAMDLLSQAGVTQIAFAVQPDTAAP
ncbi:MAG: ExbD/TolR family protein [Myxococcaceae bacterium]